MNMNEYSILFPARIVDFDPATQLATVQISAERIYNNSDEVNKLIVRKPIEGVPVHTVSGGGWSLTMPISKGDTCTIMFSQVGYDHWLYDDRDTAGLLAQLPKPQLRRMFNEDDGFCIVGFNTLKRTVANFSNTKAELRNVDRSAVVSIGDDQDKTVEVSISGSPILKVSSTGVEITGDLTVSGTVGATDIVGTGSVKVGLIDLTTHRHLGVTAGGDTSGIPTV